MNKDDILKEIRRIAEQNGGTAPGREIFTRVTGIKSYHWGKYWSKWTAALRDAGLEPNALVERISDEILFGHLITLIRQLGHFPSASELRFAWANTPGFPSKSTFQSRGSKDEIVSQLAAFCGRDSRLADVVAVCNAVPKSVRKKAASSFSEGPNDGWVYLAKSSRHYKIGRSDKPGRREAELNLLLPERCQILHEIRTDDPVGIEAYWHKRFATKRKQGEWFVLDQADISAFRRRMFM